MADLFLPCAGGVEALLEAEARHITGRDAQATRSGVIVDGDAHTALQLNLESRLAQRVLWPLAEGRYRDEHDLYDMARRVDWTGWITPAQTLRVDTSAWRSPLRSLNFANLRIKDAVCDALRDACGQRPSVDTRWPHLSLQLYVGPEHATLYADTSGEALFKRGWRDERHGAVKGEAPLKETLAAAMLAAAGWQGRAEDGPLLDPCCGAGTIAIEAAQLACGIAPGLQRRFAFERWLAFREHLGAWALLQRQARERIHAPAVAVFAGDVSFRMTDFATRNAQRAGVGHAIEFKTADALQRPAPAPGGTLMLNPPYGERIAPKGQGAQRGGRVEPRDAGADADRPPQARAREAFADGADAGDFFSRLAAHWKRHYAGWTAWVLSPQMQLPSMMRLKESRRVPLWNGAIECRLFRFDLVAGANRPTPEP